MGFYENAFRLMRECYEELPGDPATRRFRSWKDAFSPAPDVAVTDRATRGDWDFWVAHFPSGRGLPGDPLDLDSPFTVRRYLSQSARLLAELLRSAHAMEAGRRTGEQNGGCGPAPRAPTPEGIQDALDTLLKYGQLATMAAVIQAADLLQQAIETWTPPLLRAPTGPVVRLIEVLSATARWHLERLVSMDGALRRVWQVIDLIIAVLRGATVEGLAFHPDGFDAINGHDWRDWLRFHGASDISLESGFMRAIYGLVFAFEDGDVRRPRLAAGVALRGAMRMFFTYRGALFWRMNAGMGDVVFAPLYEVLRKRGVRFEFFHRLRNVKLAPPRRATTSYVEALEFDVQARVRNGEYQPLIDVRGIPSWPAKPDYRQLVNGRALREEGRAFESQWEERRATSKTLRVTDNFDFVVLGVSIGAIPLVARELVEREPKWRDMVRHVKTVPTQAFQIWMRDTVDHLGWEHPPVNLSGFTEPFDTWADMRHLIPEESWKSQVRSIAYFCSVLPDPGPPNGSGPKEYHREQRAVVRENAIRFLDSEMGALWPGAVDEGGRFRWDLLVSEARTEEQGERRFDSQHWTANVDPNDRYVLSVPGSCRSRVSPLDMSFDNLTIAGDWTASGLDTGCIESAVMSGRLAAHAISQQPPLADIVGYDHP
jgi:uncharacterized protein with NAD-binding domain and iron-sulfur cluster